MVAPAETRNTQINKKISDGPFITSETFLNEFASVSFFSLASFRNRKANANTISMLIEEMIKIAVMLTASITCPVIMLVNDQPAAPAMRNVP